AGWLELLAGKSELAEKHFSNAINFRDNKDKNTPYYALGLYLSSLANGKNEKTYLKNIKISEDDKIGILFNLIINSSNESDIEKVLNIVNEQQKMDIYFYLGEIYKFTGKKKKAEEYFKNAIQLKKFNTIEYIITMVELEILKGNITNFNFPKANINHTLLFDFEKEQISDIFNPPQGGLLSSISPLSEHLSKTINDPPLGKALKISSPQKGFLYTKKGILLENLKNYEYLTFWTYNSSNNKPIFELQFIEEGGIAKFWRRIEITKTGWTKITIPLRFMRQSENRTPSWRNIKYLGLFFRDAADIYIDNFTFLKSSEKNAILSEEELAEIAFPLTQKLQIQKLITNDYIILTNSQEIELKTLENKINEFFSTIKKDFEGVKKSEPDSPPTLIIFANQEEYRNFIPRFAALLLAQADTPKSGGYTIHSIATSFWKSDMGTLRPVYFHEIFHTWLDKFYAFPSGNGDWLQEGFANYYQITFFPQENLSKIIQTALLEGFTPLEELCNGSRISMNQYWQALTVVAMLMNKKEYRNKLTNLLNTFIEKNSVNLTAV
ncbi:MAG TPA: hypothetical protein PLN24_09895, partial [Victivallales bacterium]|nr:hypothetical protein [Victivallales bacterium]